MWLNIEEKGESVCFLFPEKEKCKKTPWRGKKKKVEGIVNSSDYGMCIISGRRRKKERESEKNVRKKPFPNLGVFPQIGGKREKGGGNRRSEKRKGLNPSPLLPLENEIPNSLQKGTKAPRKLGSLILFKGKGVGRE